MPFKTQSTEGGNAIREHGFAPGITLQYQSTDFNKKDLK